MKKNTRNIIIMLIVLVVVGAVAAVLYFTAPNEDEEITSEASETETHTLVDLAEDDIEKITIRTTEGYEVPEYSLVPMERESEEESFLMTVEEFKDNKLDTRTITNMAQTLYQLKANKSLGKFEDSELSTFGFTNGEGKANVKLQSKSGEDVEYAVGISAGETDGNYILMNGEVYIAPVSSYVFSDVYTFFDLTLINVPSLKGTDAEGNEVDKEDEFFNINISGTSIPEEIDIMAASTSTSSYIMEAPMRVDCKIEKINEFAGELKTVTADKLYKLNAEVGVIEECGLSQPTAVVDYFLNSERHEIRLGGKNEDGLNYLMYDDIDTIYLINDSKVASWAKAEVMDIRSPYIAIPNILDVTKLTLNLIGEDTVFDVTVEVNEENSTETQQVYEITKVLKNGEEVPYESYQPFYRDMISIAVLSVDKKDYDKENPYLTVTYDINTVANGNTQTVVQFFELPDEDRYVAELNGEFNGIVRKSSVEDIIAQMKAM